MQISQFLKSKPNGANFQEIQNYLEEKFYKESFDNDLAFSEKTFKRDRNLLQELFGIEISFKRSSMTYQILHDDFTENSLTIFDNLLLVNAYKQTVNQGEIMFFEKQQASGLNLLDRIIYAIKNSTAITFTYTKYWGNISSKKVIEPYALKEFRNRWYLIANERDGNDFVLKTFGLDRISELNISKSSFKKQLVNIEAMFTNSFGIVSTLNKIPKTIQISFDQQQGGFVKSLPLHHSQKIISETNSELSIELTLYPTYDFYQELLTHSERILAIAPKSIQDEYIRFLEKGINNIDS